MTDAGSTNEVQATPRTNPECVSCPTGEYEYEGQETDARGEVASLFVCGDCGHEVLRS